MKSITLTKSWKKASLSSKWSFILSKWVSLSGHSSLWASPTREACGTRSTFNELKKHGVKDILPMLSPNPRIFLPLSFSGAQQTGTKMSQELNGTECPKGVSALVELESQWLLGVVTSTPAMKQHVKLLPDKILRHLTSFKVTVTALEDQVSTCLIWPNLFSIKMARTNAKVKESLAWQMRLFS